jgi:glycosyltransferase involved in cell wall biosynthesis
MLEDENIYYVACSRWLESEAKKSALLKGHKITSIPNPIDTHIYNRCNRQEARQRLGLPSDKRLILFASQRVTNENKGMQYLIEACQLLKDIPQLGVVILGGHAEEVVSQLPLEAYPLGYVNDERRIVDVYNAADVFVLPSLSENLPNTIMEAMACGVPCVGFKVGGIPEEIDHRRNGYVADYRNAEDLARGIRWILIEADSEALSRNAVHKVVQNYSQQSVAMKYLDVYHQAMAFKHYRL